MADDMRHRDTVRPREGRYTTVSRVPRLHWDPRVHLAIVIDELALRVDHDPRIPGHAEFVALHDAEAAPDGVVSARSLEGLYLGTF